jgi:hypothetical protein
MQAVAAMGNNPSPSPSESSSSSGSEDGEESADEYEPFGQPQDNIADSPIALSESSSSSAVTPGAQSPGAQIDEDILQSSQHSANNEHAAIASPAGLEGVSSPQAPVVNGDPLISRPAEQHSVPAPQYYQRQLILPEIVAPSSHAASEDEVNPLEPLDHPTLHSAEDSLEHPSSERCYSSHSSDPALAESEDSDTASTDSRASGPIGQMNQGFVDVLREDEQEVEDDSDEYDDDDDDDISVAESDTDGENNYPSGFDYKNPIGATFSRREMLSFGFSDITLKHKIPREAARDTAELFGSVLPADQKLLDYRTARKRIQIRTGIKEIIYDCCPQSHMSFAMYPDLDQCITCQHPRWKTSGGQTSDDAGLRKIPYATHSYIPVAHRLSLLYSNADQAYKMTSYRYAAERDRQRGLRSDYWSSDLFQDMQKKGLFKEDTDLGLMISTDGVKVFKSRRSFNIWPILLVSLAGPVMYI